MTKLYSDDDLWNAYMQRRRILSVFIAVTFVWLAATVGLLIYFIMLPYKDPNQTWVKLLSYGIVALYILFAFPYMGICYHRSNCYYKTLRFINFGIKEYSVMPFEGIEDWTTRDGVDVNVALFRVRHIKRDEEMVRQIYIDGEKDFPPFEEEDMVRVVSQGNLLIEYEILSRSEE